MKTLLVRIGIVLALLMPSVRGDAQVLQVTPTGSGAFSLTGAAAARPVEIRTIDFIGGASIRVQAGPSPTPSPTPTLNTMPFTRVDILSTPRMRIQLKGNRPVLRVHHRDYVVRKVRNAGGSPPPGTEISATHVHLHEAKHCEECFRDVRGIWICYEVKCD